jgi:hypothetical protein
MDKQLIEATLKFMERVDLKGAETPVFTACVQALQAEYQKEPEKVEVKEED